MARSGYILYVVFEDLHEQLGTTFCKQGTVFERTQRMVTKCMPNADVSVELCCIRSGGYTA